MVAFGTCHSLAYWKLWFELEYMLVATMIVFPVNPTRGESAKKLLVPGALALNQKRHCPASTSPSYRVAQPTIRDWCVLGLKASAIVTNRSNITGGLPGN